MSRAESMRRVRAPRHKMFGHLLPALSIMLLLLGCACGTGHAADGAWLTYTKLFLPWITKIPEKVGGEVPKKYVRTFASPFLAAGNGVLLALAEARRLKSNEEGVDIVASHIEMVGSDWINKTTEKNGINWRTRVAMQEPVFDTGFALRNPAAVIKDNKIYLLSLSNRGPHNVNNPENWYLALAVGEIMGGPGNKTIQWNASESLHSKLIEEVKKTSFVFLHEGRSAFLTSKGKSVFSADAMNWDYKWGLVIMQLNDDEGQWEVSFVANPYSCPYVSFFEWEERLVSLLSGCTTGKSYVMQYDEDEKKWKEFNGTSLRPLESHEYARDFITVTIENKSLLLFTEEYFEKTTQVISLRCLDGEHEFELDLVAADEASLTSGGLVYTNGELFFLYQKQIGESGRVVFMRLKRQLESIKFELGIRAETEECLRKLSNKTASPDTLCATRIFNNGLVGSLSHVGNVVYWYDGYLFRNARVRRGTKVERGYTFGGNGAGAQWPVGRGGLGKVYDFTRRGMTVVATVTINETAKVNTPLLTVDGFGVKKRLGLWYKDNRWNVESMNKTQGRAIDLETHKSFNVMLVLQNNTISAYVNGTFLAPPLPLPAPEGEPFYLWNIYIGGYGLGSRINMTVTDVLLYNRAVNYAELEAARKQIAVATQNDSEDDSVYARVGAALPLRLGLRVFGLFF